ncbi:hypothetical protein ACW0TP_00315 [Fusobacterium polymorphum]
MTENSKNSIINFQKGTNEEKQPQKNIWDEMSKDMREFVEVIFLSKDKFLDREPLNLLEQYINKHGRLLYTVLSDRVYEYENLSVSSEKDMTFLTNIDILLEECEKDIILLKNKNSKELKNKKRIKRIVIKLKDHVNLAIRQYINLKQTDEEYQSKFNKQIGAFKEKVTKEITAQLITLVGIFTAIAFVVFGGISSLSSVFSDINKKSIIKLIIASSIWGMAMFNLIFGFLLGISKMTGLTIGSNKSRNFFEKYILVFWMNAIMIVIFVVTLWFYFIFKIGIFEEIFFPIYKKFLFLIGSLSIGSIIYYSFKKLISKTKNFINYQEELN